jgi:chromosome segregation ATPase
VDPVRRQIAKMNTEAMIDEIIGLRADLADQKARAARYKSERDDMAAKLAEALVGDQGKTIGNLQGQLRAAKFARDEAMAATKRMENKLKKAEARTKELENMEVSF